MNETMQSTFCHTYSVLFGLAVLTSDATCTWAEEFTYDSPYAHYIISQTGTVVEMRHLRKRTHWLESAVDLKDPLRPVVPYTAAMFCGDFFKTPAKQVLMIGLGGGGFNRLFAAVYTQTTLQTVEIDPMALELAKKHMGFVESDRSRVAILDGRQYVKRTPEKWDWIILDAFHGGYVPFHLKTSEFYAQIRKALVPDGIMVSNLHSGTALYESDVKTLLASFPQVAIFHVPDRSNLIAVGDNYESPKLADQWQRFSLDSASPVLRKYVDLDVLRKNVVDRPESETSKSAQVLTDDYSPAEYLNAFDRE